MGNEQSAAREGVSRGEREREQEGGSEEREREERGSFSYEERVRALSEEAFPTQTSVSPAPSSAPAPSTSPSNVTRGSPYFLPKFFYSHISSTAKSCHWAITGGHASGK